MRSARRMRLPDRSMTRWLSLALVSGLAGCALGAVPGETPDESLEARRVESTEIAVSWRPIDFSADAAAFSFELATETRARPARDADAAARGDFFVLEPAPGFVPVRPGERRALTLLGENWAIMKTDAPAAFHIAFDGHGAPRAVPETVEIDAADPRQRSRPSRAQ